MPTSRGSRGHETTVSAITAAVLAVLAACGSLLSGNAVNEAILGQTKATDQWAYYQAKSTKAQLYEVGGKLIQALSSTPGTASRDTQESALKQFQGEKERYDQREGRDQNGGGAPGGRESARLSQASSVRSGNRLLPGGNRPGLGLDPGSHPRDLLPECTGGNRRARLRGHRSTGLVPRSARDSECQLSDREPCFLGSCGGRPQALLTPSPCLLTVVLLLSFPSPGVGVVQVEVGSEVDQI